jgi:hypothetical protein
MKYSAHGLAISCALNEPQLPGRPRARDDVWGTLLNRASGPTSALSPNPVARASAGAGPRSTGRMASRDSMPAVAPSSFVWGAGGPGAWTRSVLCGNLRSPQHRPVVGRQLLDPTRRVNADPVEQVVERCLQINPQFLGRRAQAHQHGCRLAHSGRKRSNGTSGRSLR